LVSAFSYFFGVVSKKKFEIEQRERLLTPTTKMKMMFAFARGGW
jgi:hypothetical protein